MTDPVRKAARELRAAQNDCYGGTLRWTHKFKALEAALDEPAPEPTPEPLDDALRNAHREMADAGPRDEKDRVHHDCCLDAVMDYEGHVRRLAGLPDSLPAALARVHGKPAAEPQATPEASLLFDELHEIWVTTPLSDRADEQARRAIDRAFDEVRRNGRTAGVREERDALVLFLSDVDDFTEAHVGALREAIGRGEHRTEDDTCT